MFRTLKEVAGVWVGKKAEVVQQKIWTTVDEWNVQVAIELLRLFINRRWKPGGETRFGEKVTDFRAKRVGIFGD
jgi:hypothetical protein